VYESVADFPSERPVADPGEAGEDKDGYYDINANLREKKGDDAGQNNGKEIHEGWNGVTKLEPRASICSICEVNGSI
jgi:hypothetical protein